jgi:predicted GNAT family acetyltransferase
MSDIQHTDSATRGRFYLEQDGQLLGELTYSRAGETLAILDHTLVTDLARGTGLGRRLVDTAVAWARESGIKLIPLCPYARSVFEKDPSLADVWRK